MTKTMLASGFVALAAGLLACNVHDNTFTANIPNATLNVTADADVSMVEPAQSVPMTVNVQNVYLIEPSATPPPEHDKDAGHLQFYVDDEAKPPVLVTAQTKVTVPIPADTKPGPHKVICRVHKHDGTPTDTHFELSITVKASVTTNNDGGVSVDATVTIEAGTTTTHPDAAAT